MSAWFRGWSSAGKSPAALFFFFVGPLLLLALIAQPSQAAWISITWDDDATGESQAPALIGAYNVAITQDVLESSGISRVRDRARSSHGVNHRGLERTIIDTTTIPAAGDSLDWFRGAALVNPGLWLATIDEPLESHELHASLATESARSMSFTTGNIWQSDRLWPRSVDFVELTFERQFAPVEKEIGATFRISTASYSAKGRPDRPRFELVGLL